jgi:non-specific serine/threonine protein kinase
MIKEGSLLNGGYRILKQLDKSSSNTVYLAFNEMNNRQLAIKEIGRESLNDRSPITWNYFIEDIRKLANFRHRNLPIFYEVIQEGDFVYIVMEYVEGNKLSTYLQANGALLAENAVSYTKQLCSVLSYLHNQEKPYYCENLIPDNIIVQLDGRVVLLGFGSVYSYNNDYQNYVMRSGIRGYISPERLSKSIDVKIDATSDIYSLGTILYYMLTGKNPSEPPYEIKPIRKINPELPQFLERIVDEATSQSQQKRYQSADKMLNALEGTKDNGRSSTIKVSSGNKKGSKALLVSIPICIILIFALVFVAKDRIKNNSDNYVADNSDDSDNSEETRRRKRSKETEITIEDIAGDYELIDSTDAEGNIDKEIEGEGKILKEDGTGHEYNKYSDYVEPFKWKVKGNQITIKKNGSTITWNGTISNGVFTVEATFDTGEKGGTTTYRKK